jgi:hypothetical protein
MSDPTTTYEEFEVCGDNLLRNVRELIHEGNVTKGRGQPGRRHAARGAHQRRAGSDRADGGPVARSGRDRRAAVMSQVTLVVEPRVEDAESTERLSA